MIENPIQTQRALLTWRRPFNYGGQRDRYAVAELVQEQNRVRFSWRADAVEAARANGFNGYPGLTGSLGENSYDAIGVLLRRLPPRDRHDFSDYLQKFGVTSGANLSDLSLLAYTGARVVSESDGFGVAETFDGFDRPFRYIFDIAGFVYHLDNSVSLRSDDAVYFEPEDTNSNDPQAVRLVGPKGLCLGYVNRTQTQKMRSWLAVGTVKARVFQAVKSVPYARLFVEADIVPQLHQEVAA